MSSEDHVSAADPFDEPDNRYTFIHYYLTKGKHHPDVPKNRHSGIRKAVKKYAIQGNSLYYGNRLVCRTEEERASALQQCHDNPGTGGHHGINNTRHKVQEAYYWLGMTSDVEKWISECDMCQRSTKMKTMAPILHPIKTEAPWEMIGIDLIGPFPETDSGNKYICTMTCLFSKFVYARAIQTKGAAAVCEVLLDFIYLYGPPQKFLSDQGREFVNEINNFLFKKFEVKHSMTSAYHPQCNGQDERTNQTLKKALIKYCNSEQTDWDEHIAGIVYSMNTCRQKSTKHMPYHVLFRRKPNSFVNGTDDVRDVQLLTDEMMKELIDKATELDAQIKANIEVAQAKQIKQYEARKNRGVKSFNFSVGNQVLRMNMVKKGRKGSRLEADWLGPYEVTAVHGRGTVSLSKDGKDLKAHVNVTQLKPYKKRNSGSEGETEHSEGSKPANMTKQNSAVNDLSIGSKGQTEQAEGSKPAKMTKQNSAINDLSINPAAQLCTKLPIRKKKPVNQPTPFLHRYHEASDFFRHMVEQGAVSQLLQHMSTVDETIPKNISEVISGHKQILPQFLLEVDDNQLLDTFGNIVASNQDVAARGIDMIGYLAGCLAHMMVTGQNVKSLLDSFTPKPNHLEDFDECRQGLRQPMFIGNNSFTLKDLTCLEGKTWLTDKVINAFCSNLQRTANWKGGRVLALTSFLAEKWQTGSKGMKQWIYKSVKMASFDMILVPVCSNQHWFLMVIRPKTQTVGILDSMSSAVRATKFAHYWIEYMAYREQVVPEGLEEWQQVQLVSNQQQDGDSCGVFTCMNAECLVKKVNPLTMRQHHTTMFRQYIHHALLNNYNTDNCDSKLCQRPKLKKLNWLGCDSCFMWEHYTCSTMTNRRPICTQCY